ncbi:GNAT family N-acetyltransferase [Pseudomonas sp.]|uniref:GNAT family N-acetyltransferase n=1 Tax=Pseudomonas sp. TaxID=306 RepID=UPI0027371E82|nr:GNAT family N-acetyltransferase [Pseudomonas sp.]MDP2745074.1 GNAT family N-acetyltransferase [Pseudomonas sp.]
MSPLQIAPLPAAQDAAALELLDQAFASDPTLAWYLLSEQPGYAPRRRAYLQIYHQLHRANRLPILAAWQAGQLLGVSYYNPGHHEIDPHSLQQAGQAIAEHCGVACLEQLDLLIESFERHLGATSFALIEFIGVASGQQGRGIGSALLAQTLADCRQQACPGVALETGEARNLALYQRHGFQPSGHLHLPGLQQHYLQQSWPTP